MRVDCYAPSETPADDKGTTSPACTCTLSSAPPYVWADASYDRTRHTYLCVSMSHPAATVPLGSAGTKAPEIATDT